jgi:hypothetical protein
MTGWVAFAVLVLAALVLFARKSRARAAPSAIAAGLVTLASGLVTMGLSVAHLVVVVNVALGRSPLVYDFRLYSLLLLGIALTGLGLALALAAAGVTHGDPARTRLARNSALLLALINVPLAPLQGFAVLLAALAGVTLAAVYARGRNGSPDTP